MIRLHKPPVVVVLAVEPVVALRAVALRPVVEPVELEQVREQAVPGREPEVLQQVVPLVLATERQPEVTCQPAARAAAARQQEPAAIPAVAARAAAARQLEPVATRAVAVRAVAAR